MSRDIAKRYEMEPSPPEPWAWERYRRFLAAEWKECLGTAQMERTMQQFLDAHPCLLPGGEGGGESVGGHHGPFPQAVVSQPELPGLSRPKPDFLWITKTSAAIEPVLIEIEKPTKRWFTKKGVPTADLTQARSQISQWKAWLAIPAHQTLFSERYVLDDYARRHLPIAPRYVLVYGRRDEATANREASQQRIHQASAHVVEMTYDRLSPHPTASNCVTATVGPDGWKVVNIPPTFRLGPNNAEDLLQLGGWETAINENRLLSKKRKAFLLKRLDYWREFARRPSKGLVQTGDWE